MPEFINKIQKGIAQPFQGLDYLLSILIGYYYRIRYSFLTNKATFGKGLRVRGKLKIQGPGKVF